MWKKLLLVLALVLAGAAVAVLSILRKGVSARDEPTAAEILIARRLRHLAVPLGARLEKNPLRPTGEILAKAAAHFADHCALCHGNDGRGQTPMGRNLYPKAPDMQSKETQSLSDGELFYIIQNGVRLTGMPAWGGGHSPDRESWELVLFIRHLPSITPDELHKMSRFNPRNPEELREEAEEEKFLEGGAESPPAH